MLTASESKAALSLVTDEAVVRAVAALGLTSGSATARRAVLLDVVPDVIRYYADGSSALAADYYDDERERAAPPKLYVAEPVVVDREVKIRRAVAWASEPLFDGAEEVTAGRLAQVVQLESARPFRDTIVENRKRDPSAVGWRRVASGGCKFCRMLADRGAVYTDATALFASHENCKCTAQPVFSTNDFGEEADAMQYLASRRRRSPEQQAALRDYLNTNYPDFPG
jgi:hypothetical protein